MIKIFIILLAIISSMFTSTASVAREWLVDRVSGTAYTISQSRERLEIKREMKIAEGLTIATGPNGRVRLVSENNVMTFLPNSVAAVVPKSFFSSKTEVRQKAGSIEFDVEKRRQPHFVVQTPYMAAVVKGTKFTVSVAKANTNIGVTRGLVQVSDLRTGQTAAVGAGQNASVASAEGGLRTGGVSAPEVTPGEPASPAVAPAGMTIKEFRAAARVGDPSDPSTKSETTNAGPTTASNASQDQSSGTASGNSGESGKNGSRGNGSGDDGENGTAGGNGNGDRNAGENGSGNGNAGGDGNGTAGGGGGNGNAGGNDRGSDKGKAKDNEKGKADGNDKSNADGKDRGIDNGKAEDKSNGNEKDDNKDKDEGNDNDKGNGKADGKGKAEDNGKGKDNDNDNDKAGGNDKGDSKS